MKEKERGAEENGTGRGFGAGAGAGADVFLEITEDGGGGETSVIGDEVGGETFGGGPGEENGTGTGSGAA